MNDLFVTTPSSSSPSSSSTDRHRIFISGIAGSGKTTLLDKITFDWARKNKGIKHLDEFDFIFLIKLSQLSSYRISTFCLQKYFRNKLSEKTFIEISEQNKVLFILDGYDEFDQTNQELNHLFQGEVYQNCSFLCTSRPGTQIEDRYFDINYNIRGLSEQNVKLFLNRFRNHYNVQSLLPSENHPLRPLLSVPIFLWFYALLHEELKVYENDVPTRTKLYEQILNALKKKYVKRVKINNEKELTQTLKVLSKQAYHCLCEDRLWFKGDFNNNDVSKYMSERQLSEESRMTALGVVVKQRKRNDLNSESVFTFSHKTFLEYLAAQYVCESKKTIRDLLSNVKECTDENRRNASLFLQFVLGHLKDSSKLETVFQNFVPDLSKDEHYGLECVAECDFFKSLKKSWSRYIPEEVTLDMSSNTSYLQKGLDIMTLKCKTYKLKRVNVHCHNTTVRGKMAILYRVLSRAEYSLLSIRGECDVNTLLEYTGGDYRENTQ